MTNNKLIEKLEEIKRVTEENSLARINTQYLIDDLKLEERLKGFSTNEKERLKLSLSIQKKQLSELARPSLALWHKLNGKCYFLSSSASAGVRLDEKDFFDELLTTDKDHHILLRKHRCYYDWNSERNNYPNVEGVWNYGDCKKIALNMPQFMAWLKSNCKEEVVGVRAKGELICFDPQLVYNFLIISKVAQKTNVVFKFKSPTKPFMFDEECIVSPMFVKDERIPKEDLIYEL